MKVRHHPKTTDLILNGKISEGINMEKKTERILQLYRMLYEGKAITKSDLAARFDVNEKTIQRDIEDIRAFLDNKAAVKKHCFMTGAATVTVSYLTTILILQTVKYLRCARFFLKADLW